MKKTKLNSWVIDNNNDGKKNAGELYKSPLDF